MKQLKVPLYSVFLAGFLAVSGLCQALPEVSPGEVGISASRLKRLEDFVRGLVEREELAGAVTLIARHGKIAQWQAYGWSDREEKIPMKPDTLFRIASMTKPVTSVAVMILYEEGHFLLNDPISWYIPAFREPRVLVPAPAHDLSAPPYRTEPARREITIRDLLTHTSGISYRFLNRRHLVDLYREAEISDGLAPPDETVAGMVQRLARLPLAGHPGEVWEYGLSTDVLGYLVEVVSGKSLEEFFRERIFQPLGMVDTHFYPPPEKCARLAAVYSPGESRGLQRVRQDPVRRGEAIYSVQRPCEGPSKYFSGGAGLVSTASDYARFLQMLLDNGELEGVRILSPKTVELITTNHIGDLRLWNTDNGRKFGLGFSILVDLGRSGEVGSPGSFGWGGFYHTHFWVDPVEDLIGIFLSQLYPHSHLQVRQKFEVLTYQALVD